VKYVVLIHSRPEPWGHPTDAYTDEGRAQPQEYHDEAGRSFDERLQELHDRGEFVHAEALGDPAHSRVVRWTPTSHPATDGPYAETAEQLAGFFVIDVATRERAEEVADWFAQPAARSSCVPAGRGEPEGPHPALKVPAPGRDLQRWPRYRRLETSIPASRAPVVA
jgi:hypothetical protein